MQRIRFSFEVLSPASNFRTFTARNIFSHNSVDGSRCSSKSRSTGLRNRRRELSL